ncbi:MAG: fumarylacetoacetate hydrolase family protein, partial [Verrucomicrobia bacterium]|nr:fumarylacetoacetate hydrolase family protein [Verrucomicrobiota bacterium]
MKIIRFIDNQDFIRHGVLEDDGTAVLLEGELFGEHRASSTSAVVKKLLAPLAPVSIPCIGLNYRQHATETNAPIPQWPVLFHKPVSTVQNPGDAIEIPTHLASTRVDYECELAVIIGRRAKNVSKADALN